MLHLKYRRNEVSEISECVAALSGNNSIKQELSAASQKGLVVGSRLFSVTWCTGHLQTKETETIIEMCQDSKSTLQKSWPWEIAILCECFF